MTDPFGLSCSCCPNLGFVSIGDGLYLCSICFDRRRAECVKFNSRIVDDICPAAPPICANCKHSRLIEYQVWSDGYGHLWWRQPGEWRHRAEMICAASREIDTGLLNFEARCIIERSSLLGCGPSGCLFEAKDTPAEPESVS